MHLLCTSIYRITVVVPHRCRRHQWDREYIALNIDCLYQMKISDIICPIQLNGNYVFEIEDEWIHFFPRLAVSFDRHTCWSECTYTYAIMYAFTITHTDSCIQIWRYRSKYRNSIIEALTLFSERNQHINFMEIFIAITKIKIWWPRKKM